MATVSERIAGLSPEQRARLEALLAAREGQPCLAIPQLERRGGVVFPLSFAQQRLWYLDRLARDNLAYRIPLAVRLDGPLDVAALRGALEALIARHEALRTRFVEQHGQPAQVIADPPAFALPLLDLRQMPAAERELYLNDRFREEIARPFDLARDLMLRATLARLGDEEHALLLVIHHIAFDQWSTEIFWRELEALYADGRAGHATLPPLPIQYADFAVWQREQLQGERLERHLAYWKEQLAGAPALMQLPADRPRPPLHSFRGARMRLALSREVTGRIKELARREGATLFMTMLAAFQALLHRYSGQEQIVVGTPIASRSRAEVEGVIGMFLNTLALRGDLSGDPTFRQLLLRVRETALGAFSHQDLPFEKLVEELQPERTLSHAPIFQVMFVLQNGGRGGPALEGLKVQPLRGEGVTAKFDLALTLSDRNGELRGSLEYNTDLFDAERIERMLEHFRTLVEGIAADPDERVSRLPLVTSSERERIAAWNATAAPCPQRCVQHLFEEQVQRTPNAPALQHNGATMTYGELNARADHLARHLRAHGVGPETRVGLCADRSPQLLIALLAILKAGAAYVPIDPIHPRHRINFMLRDASVTLLLLGGGAAEAVGDTGIPALRVDAPLPALAPLAPAAEPDASCAAYVLYTSGSTGQPKGVVMRHGSLVNLISWQLRQFPSPARTLQFSSIGFDVSFQEIFSTWCAGGTLVLVSEEERRDPPALLRMLDEARVERLFLPFAVLQHLAIALAAGAAVPRSLREVITAGEQLQATGEILSFFERSGARLFNHYGPTEAHVVTAFELPTEPRNWLKLPPIGMPIANAQIRLLDRCLQPVPVGVPGELYIGGDCLARGYRGRPELTAECFVPDPFGGTPGARLYRTGDLARYRADGNIEYLGRTDHQVKIRGFRIEPGEIESLLSDYPRVQEAVVVARDDVPGDRRLVAYVVSRSGALEPAALREYLRERLPAYMIPSAFETLHALPLNANGKLDYSALPAPRRQEGCGSNFERPRSAWEELLAGIWRDVLGREDLGIHDDFFDLGGHSLLAVQMLSRVRETFGIEIPLTLLFQGATIADLALAIRDGIEERALPTLVPIQPRGTKRPLFCVAAPAVNSLGYVFLARHLGDDQPIYGLQRPWRREAVTPYSDDEYRTLAREYLQAMRTVQPRGPYVLLGLCEGAHIAFTMVRELEAAGEQVDLLVVLDTWPVENSRRPMLVRIHRLARWWKRIGRHRPDLFRLPNVLRHIVSQLRDPTERECKRAWDQRYHPGRSFAPARIQAPILVLRIEKQPYWRPRDPLLGWGGRTTGSVQSRSTSGEHAFLLREPHVDLVARHLAGHLRLLDGPAVGAPSSAALAPESPAPECASHRPVRRLPPLLRRTANRSRTPASEIAKSGRGGSGPCDHPPGSLRLPYRVGGRAAPRTA